MYKVMFWNVASECVPVFGTAPSGTSYCQYADTYEEAMNIAVVFLIHAHNLGATEMSVSYGSDVDVYPIEDD